MQTTRLFRWHNLIVISLIHNLSFYYIQGSSPAIVSLCWQGSVVHLLSVLWAIALPQLPQTLSAPATAMMQWYIQQVNLPTVVYSLVVLTMCHSTLHSYWKQLLLFCQFLLSKCIRTWTFPMAHCVNIGYVVSCINNTEHVVCGNYLGEQKAQLVCHSEDILLHCLASERISDLLS